MKKLQDVPNQHENVETVLKQNGKNVSDTFKWIGNGVSSSSKILDTERVIFTKRSDGSLKKIVIKETFANVIIRKKEG